MQSDEVIVLEGITISHPDCWSEGAVVMGKACLLSDLKRANLLDEVKAREKIIPYNALRSLSMT